MMEIVWAALWSISPFGEAKVGLPYAIFNGINIYYAFVICFLANLLVFPLMMFFLEKLNLYFFKWKWYKISALFVARRAKNGAGKNVKKYGFWGLLFFVMLPVPGTGVYAGSIASYILRMDKKRAFAANSIGIFLSCVIVWSMTVLTSTELIS